MKFQISKNCEYVLKAVDDGYQDHQFLSRNSPKMSRYDEKLLQKGCRKVQIALFSYFLQIFLKLAIRRRFLQKSVLRDPLWCYIWWYISFGPTKHLRSCQTKSCFGPFLHDSFCGTHQTGNMTGFSHTLSNCYVQCSSRLNYSHKFGWVHIAARPHCPGRPHFALV